MPKFSHPFVSATAFREAKPLVKDIAMRLHADDNSLTADKAVSMARSVIATSDILAHNAAHGYGATPEQVTAAIEEWRDRREKRTGRRS